MNYRCGYCLQAFAWEDGTYQSVRSMILLHLGRCSTYGARSLSAGERSAEATRVTDELFVLPGESARPARPDVREGSRKRREPR